MDNLKYNNKTATNTGNKYAKALASATGWNYDSGTGTVGNTDYPAKRNATGFTALPGGNRGNGGTFYAIGGLGRWWSATEYSTNYAFYVGMGYDNSDFYKYNYYKEFGFSVRCVRD